MWGVGRGSHWSLADAKPQIFERPLMLSQLNIELSMGRKWKFKNHLRWSSLAGQLFCQIFQTDIIQNGGWSIHPLVVNQSVIGGDRKVI